LWLLPHEHMFAIVQTMTPQQLEHLASRHAVLVSTVLYLPHPKDGYEAWRCKWGQVTDLVDEISRMVRIAD
jgi:hypothetical protein